jgi:YaeC family lipoprotein
MSPALREALWSALGETITMVVLSSLLAALAGLPLAVLLLVTSPGHLGPRRWVHTSLGAAVNATRSVPFIILLVTLIPLTRWLVGTSIGTAAAIVPLALAAAPFVARLYEEALRQVDPAVIEAARSFGATRGQIIARVIVPEALPGLVRATTVMVVSLVGSSAMAGAVGGGGLGDLGIRHGYQRFQPVVMAAVVAVLVVLVNGLQWVGDRVARHLSRDETVVVTKREVRMVLAAAAALALLALARSKRDGRLRVGVTSGPHAQIIEVVAQQAARRGTPIEVVEFADYVQPNAALADGSLDANSFQHRPYLDQQIKDRGYRFEVAGTTVVFPIAAYSRRHGSLDALPRGATLAIPNDPSNGARALRLLATAGLLTLPASVSADVSALDVKATRQDYTIKELDAAQLVHSLPDLDLAVINTNYALEAGLDPMTSLLRESAQSPYANVLVVRAGDAKRQEIKALVEAYHSPEVRAFVETTFKGAILPAW